MDVFVHVVQWFFMYNLKTSGNQFVYDVGAQSVTTMDHLGIQISQPCEGIRLISILSRRERCPCLRKAAILFELMVSYWYHLFSN